MKAFKKLFSIVLAVAMILSMSVTAFAGNGKITILNPGEETYLAYKIFDAETVTANNETTVKYTIEADSEWLSKVYDTTNNKSNIAGLTFTSETYPVGEGDAATTKTRYIVTKGLGFTAENLAEKLKEGGVPSGADPISFSNGSTADNLDDGYYLVVVGTAPDLAQKAMLVTVLDGEEAKIQNKNDMPLDKTVDGVKTEGVQVGQTLHFEINGKVPAVGDDDTFYAYYVSDIMDKGLAFDKSTFKVTIIEPGFETYENAEALINDGVGVWNLDETIYYDTYRTPVFEKVVDTDTDEVTYYALDAEGNRINTKVELTVNDGLTEIDVPNATLSGDQVRFDKNGKTFELSLDMISRKSLAGQPIVITYNATVTEDAVARVEENWAILEYGNNPENLEIKDSKTKVYDSQIIIDKFETDAPERKLAGAKFVLYKNEGTDVSPVLKYYKEQFKTYEASEITDLVEDVDFEEVLDSETGLATYYALDKDGDWIFEIQFVDDVDDATEVVTDADGRAKFIGLMDGTYYIEETEAPVDYVKLAEPVEIVVANGDCITPGLSDDEVAMMLTETASINNTIGTNLPSTGGIGTTIFYVLGAILVIAGGVVLVTRRRMSA